jgi:hypothetical protein
MQKVGNESSLRFSVVLYKSEMPDRLYGIHKLLLLSRKKCYAINALSKIQVIPPAQLLVLIRWCLNQGQSLT